MFSPVCAESRATYLNPLFVGIFPGSPPVLGVVEAGAFRRPVGAVLGRSGDLVRMNLPRFHAQSFHTFEIWRGRKRAESHQNKRDSRCIFLFITWQMKTLILMFTENLTEDDSEGLTGMQHWYVTVIVIMVIILKSKAMKISSWLFSSLDPAWQKYHQKLIRKWWEFLVTFKV